jgi:hypothetical protein
MSNKIVVLVVVVPVGFTLFCLLENQRSSFILLCSTRVMMMICFGHSSQSIWSPSPVPFCISLVVKGVSQFKAARCNQIQQSQAQVLKSSTLCTFQLRKSFSNSRFLISSLVHEQQPLPKTIQNSVVSHHDHEFYQIFYSFNFSFEPSFLKPHNV